MPFDVEILEEVFAHHAENLLALAVGLLSSAESEIRIDDLFDALAFSIQGRAACWNTPPERLKVKRKFRHRAHEVTDILDGVVDETIAKTDEPNVAAIQLSH